MRTKLTLVLAALAVLGAIPARADHGSVAAAGGVVMDEGGFPAVVAAAGRYDSGTRNEQQWIFNFAGTTTATIGAPECLGFGSWETGFRFDGCGISIGPGPFAPFPTLAETHDATYAEDNGTSGTINVVVSDPPVQG